MISITKLELTNIQCHDHLIIDFKNDINIISGASDKGKSVIRRAIEFLLNWYVSDGIRKSGTKQSSVKGWFSNGVILERIKSSSINRYLLITSDNKEHTFDAIGKTIPEEITNILKIDPILIGDEEIYLNSYPQLALPFLFDRSPSERMKLFNKLSGNDLIDELFVAFNKDNLKLNKELKEYEEKLPVQEELLKNKEIEKEKLEAKYNKAKILFKNIEDLNNIYCNLLQLLELYSVNNVNIVEVKNRLKTLKLPQDIDIKGLKEKIKELETLKNLLESFKTNESSVKLVQDKLDKIVDFSSINLHELKVKLQTIDKLKDVCYTYNKKAEELEINQIKLNKVSKEKQELINQYKTVLKEIKICPLCKTEFSDKCLEEIIKS